jgi:hypothetical protein
MNLIREVNSIDGNASSKLASLQEVTNPDGTFWLYYTLGADLAARLLDYAEKGWTLGDPELTGLYSFGLPYHRRQIVKRDKGPSPEQALADSDGENEFPRFMANAPVSYVRRSDGQEWLVYQRGSHMRQALDELWRTGRAVTNVEYPCVGYSIDDKDNASPTPLVYNGKRVYRRLIVKNDSRHAVKPDSIK